MKFLKKVPKWFLPSFSVQGLFLWIVKMVLLFLLIIFIFIGSVKLGCFGKLKTKDDIFKHKLQTASLVYSKNNELIGKFYTVNRTNVQLDVFPKHLLNALISTEDARFFEHSGIDYKSLLRVLFKTILLREESSGGGSTLSQQLVKNIFGRESHGFLTMPVNKVKELFNAKKLEQLLTKEEILELYLNTVPFGENTYGIEAASQKYFSKSAQNLGIEEAALLIGMLKANTTYNPRLYPENAQSRRNIVLQQMQKANYLNQLQVDSLSKLPITLDYKTNFSKERIHYFLKHVEKEAQHIVSRYNTEQNTELDINKDGLKIYTTIDNNLQLAAIKAFEKHLGKMQEILRKQYEKGSYKLTLANMITKTSKSLKKDDIPKKQEVVSWKGNEIISMTTYDSIRYALTTLHGGFICTNPNTGAILSWVGGCSYQYHPFDQVTAMRPIASTFKPILYLSALEQGTDPCHYLSNDSLYLEKYEWGPENYDHSFGGSYSMAGALKKSMNIPSVNLFLEQKFENIHETWKKLGFSQELQPKPSSALGTSNASILELSMAYATFANGGHKVTPYTIDSIVTAKGEKLYTHKKVKETQLFSDRSIRIMNQILQDAINEGTGTAIRSKYNIQVPLAGKTGTSQNYSDAWFAAYNPSMVMVTRVGANLPSIHFQNGATGSGSKLALPIIALTLKNCSPSLLKSLKRNFPDLAINIQQEMECEDFKDPKLEDFIVKHINKVLKKLPKTKSRNQTQSRTNQSSQNENFLDKVFSTKKKKKRKRRRKYQW